jgi:hypothetical protein
MQRLLIVFLIIGVVGCRGAKKPDHILTHPQLSALLVDVYLAESRVETLPLSKDSSIRYFIPFEEKMLKAKGIPDSILKKTYAYYLANPKELEQVYDAVIDTLVVREQRARNVPLLKPVQPKTHPE